MPTLTGTADVKSAAQEIVKYLENTRKTSIYFDGWHGLGASAVLRAIAEHPPPSLWDKFDKIIHIDCSRWTSRRALQRAIADKLKLTQQVASDFDNQDEEDDFSGVDQSSRAEIGSVARVIVVSLVQYSCLVIFHNGNDGIVDLLSCGIPQVDLMGTKLLWTFRGRLRLGFWKTRQVWSSSNHDYIEGDSPVSWTSVLEEEAREIALYMHELGLGVTPEIATECCLYLLSLNYRHGGIIDYNWATHACSYWVCDGIVEGGQDNQAWELAHALRHQIRLEDYSSNTVPTFAFKLDASKKHWISIANSNFDKVPPGTTSLFFATPLQKKAIPVPNDRFHEADQLRVLKLCRCTFSFSLPPFHCCRNLRFLGLDSCMDEDQQGEEEAGARAVETFQRLWVLDVSHTNWELGFPLETEESLATDIREVHINKGRIWRRNLLWRRLPNLRNLRVVEPTSSWETGRQDEFSDMVNLELLDLSGNNSIKVLPSLSGATNLKALVLDGCVGLEHVGPQGLPPSLESFCFSSGLGKGDQNKGKISRISLAGCARLADFRLHGSLPNLEELDLSHTAVKMLDLKHEAAVQNLQKIFLQGCEQLHSISWPETWLQRYRKVGHRIRLLCIDTRAGREVSKKPSSCDALMVCQGDGEEYCRAFVATADMRFLQSLEFLYETTKLKLNLYFSSTIKEDRTSCSTGRLVAGLPLPKSMPYHDVDADQQIMTLTDGSSGASATMPFQPLEVHAEIGEGISDVPNTVSAQGRRAITFVMNRVESLRVHDSSSITNVGPAHVFMSRGVGNAIVTHLTNDGPAQVFMSRGVGNAIVMYHLKWCCVERCPKLETVFAINYDDANFPALETFWAAHLLMARSIWSRPTRPWYQNGQVSFKALRAIHLHFCPRLIYVLMMSSNFQLSNQLETLHILCCGNLTHVFPVEDEFQEKIAASNEKPWEPWKSRKGMLAFPYLRHLYLHELPNLQLICEAKMFAPDLETIYIRGCWSLRRLPATDAHRRQDGRPVAVDCEKEWWDNLEWDGMEHGHHPSLFQLRHSKYSKKRNLRGTVLR